MKKQQFVSITLKDLIREHAQNIHALNDTLRLHVIDEVQSHGNLNDREVHSFHSLAERQAEEERLRRLSERQLSVKLRKFKSVGRINTGNHHNVEIIKKGGK